MINRENIVLEMHRGSYVHGTFVEGVSDYDKIGIYIQPIEELYSIESSERISDEKSDIVYYEIGKFMRLLEKNDPTTIEMLFTPQEYFTIYNQDIIGTLFEKRNDFITSMCKDTFYHYAKSQINKATGLNKKANLPPESIIRKDLLDFTYTTNGNGSISIKKFLEDNDIKQEKCGLVAIPHMRNTYYLYYSETIPYKGIVSDIKTSNQPSLSSIPKGEDHICTIYINTDEYSIHCRKHKEYMEYLSKRNTNRYRQVTNKNGSTNTIDAKNLMHCIRLLRMGKEILLEGKINVDRRGIDADYLLEIKQGKHNLETLLEEANDLLESFNEKDKKFSIREKIERTEINELLIYIRKKFYGCY